MHTMAMKLNEPAAYREMEELDVIRRHLDVQGARILELGCGAAWMTRLLARQLRPARILATEVDQVQHAKNLALPDLPVSVEFRLGGAQRIDAPDGVFDTVFMFKSLHHVPMHLLGRAMAEIHRVLRPGGVAYFSEPVYWGEFNALLSRFNDEREVREKAFQALCLAVEQGLFELRAEVFFQVPGVYPDWETFARRFIHVTHTRHELSDALYAEVKQAFERHLGADGAHFLKPHRVDILRRLPAV